MASTLGAFIAKGRVRSLYHCLDDVADAVGGVVVRVGLAGVQPGDDGAQQPNGFVRREVVNAALGSEPMLRATRGSQRDC